MFFSFHVCVMSCMLVWTQAHAHVYACTRKPWDFWERCHWTLQFLRQGWKLAGLHGYSVCLWMTSWLASTGIVSVSGQQAGWLAQVFYLRTPGSHHTHPRGGSRDLNSGFKGFPLSHLPRPLALCKLTVAGSRLMLFILSWFVGNFKTML